MGVTAAHEQAFVQDGRGPVLKRVHYKLPGALLAATDYVNPHDEQPRHLLFVGSQVFMFTPEEVHNALGEDVPWGSGIFASAGIACLGRSSWVKSFAQTHLSKCQHFRIMFYDEFLDVICERIEAKQGGYVEA